jgi:predicted nucleic acid-binding protein
VDSQVCVDANLGLKLVIAEPDSDEAELKWQAWLEAGLEIVTPFLFIYETSSVLRNHVYRKELTQEEADEALRLLSDLTITYLHPAGLQQSAWEIARRFNRPTVYDGFYVALARQQGCPFWTADRRLYNAVKHELDWVHLLPRG